MEHSARILTVFSIILIVCAAFAGCSDNAGQAADTTPAGTVAAPTTAGPLYSAGDIVRSSSGSTSSGWLVIGYDAATDSYTRAFISQNPDGSWGYRTSGDTETAKRAVMEKVYTVKITHVAVSSVPTSAPTVVATSVPTTAKTVTKTTVATTATTAAQKPIVKDTDPEDGNAGETVSVTVTGSNFQDGATVSLKHTGESDIEATNVNWVSSIQITCKFKIPSDAETGVWDIVVTNPDKKTGKISNFFMIHGK